MRALLLAAAAVVAMTGPAVADEALASAVEDDFDYLGALYRHLHANPELSFAEEATAARIATELRDLDFEVTEGVGQTGIVGIFENGDGPTVLIRTDLDALPVPEQTGLEYASTATGTTLSGDESPVMHACGHDVHMTSLVGTARRLVALREEWSGTLVMIGQPAEELGQGARAMLDDGLYERFALPDYNLALHTSASMPAGTIGYASGYALANVDSVDVTVHGVGGHGAYPHTTIDPIVLSAQIILGLQTLVSRNTSPLEPAVITVGSIHAGSKHNIIPDTAQLQITVRSYTDEVREALLTGIERVAHGQARSAGVPDDMFPEVSVRDEFTPSTYNDPDLAARAAAAIAEQIGADNVFETDPVMGGEDFGQFGRTGDDIPGLLFWAGGVDPDVYADAQENGTPLPSLHSPLFAPEPHATITTAVQAMTAAALDLFNGGE